MTVTWTRALVAAGIAVVGLGVAGFALSHHPTLPALDPAKPQTFDPALVQKGEVLAALGACAACHTAEGGKPYAGGLGLQTPFGVIYASNITPDPTTGIGTWSREAFARAMREGVDREGQNLYPAFPYSHYAKVSDPDIDALYAYVMTRTPVAGVAPDTHLPFPLSYRPLLAGWNLLFLSSKPYEPDATQDATWNRGAYLVEGLAHCGACHTPRNPLGAERAAWAFTGAPVEGWYAFNLEASSPSKVPWTVAALTDYLRQGWHGLHGVSRGPMEAVSANLATVPEADVQAMAVYVASLMGTPSDARTKAADTLIAALPQQDTGSKPQSAGSQTLPVARDDASPGAALYTAACASCHEAGRAVPFGGLHLSLSAAVSADSPANLLNIVLAGLPATDGAQGPVMPGFGATMTDNQMADLATYLRQHFGTRPEWSDLKSQIARARTVSN